MNASAPDLNPLLAERDRRKFEAELARRTFGGFVGYTRRDYIWSRFSREVCAAIDRFLDDVHKGKRPILVLQAPPQHGKSELVSRMLAPYIFGRWPNTRIAACSYSADLAKDMNRDVQRIMMASEFREVYPRSALNTRRAAHVEGEALRNSDRFDIVGKKGYYLATGIGGPLTGKSVDIGIIDDPIKNEAEARSPAVKKGIRSWYETVFLTRLSKRSGQIIMATSWATDDLAATILKDNPDAVHLKFPAINDNGEALVPELHPLEQLLQFKRLMAPAKWSALFQQNAVQDGGNIFQEAWIQEWFPADLPPVFDEVIQSWDMTFKDTLGSDFVVGQIWGKRGAAYYLLDQIRDRMSFTATVEAVLVMTKKWPEALAKLVEDKANGPAVISTLKNTVPGLIPIEPDGSKVARASAVTPLWKAGNVYVPRNAAWRKDFDGEVIAFPAGSNDDQVDAMTQALRYFVGDSLAIWETLGQ
ncbi:phage terminase large subunit [Rhodospirillum sp. A1_3_36]|uniref:phage terminase large subunit n=1 Tax=Rhodospirillum sp. A1_3_36 TaxID=3391666 RepID=UPI0039A5DA46